MDVYSGFVFAGLSVSFLHAILPNHWLPFVLAGRAQKWSIGKTLSIVTLAGGGHVLITTLLGVLIVWMGIALTEYIEAWAEPLAAGVLILFGLFYVVQHFRGVGHSHFHIPGLGHSHDHHGHERSHHDHDHHDHNHDDHEHGHNHHDHDNHDHHEEEEEEDDDARFAPDKVAVISLIALLTFSPCEGFLPIYLTAWPHGWAVFVLLSAVLAIGTLAGMLVFTGLTFLGVQKLEVLWLERIENLILGGVLILLGIGVVLLHQ